MENAIKEAAFAIMDGVEMIVPLPHVLVTVLEMEYAKTENAFAKKDF